MEEFDLPLEYGASISKDEQLEVGKKGLDSIQDVLNDIPVTLFTTAYFALSFEKEIKELSQKHEIASHAYYHSTFERQDLLKSKNELERITGKEVRGLRMPRLRPVDVDWIKEAGYKYDSSINPTWIPGRYNNRDKPRTVYTDNGLTRLPTSVTPNLRIPLFWLAFKNMPYSLFLSLAIQTLKKDNYLSFYFHPWEFTDISRYKLPFYVKRHSGNVLINRLKRLISDLAHYGEFKRVDEFLLAYNQ